MKKGANDMTQELQKEEDVRQLITKRKDDRL